MTDLNGYKAAYRAASDATDLAQGSLKQAKLDIDTANRDILAATARLADVLNDADPGASLDALTAAEAKLARAERLADAMTLRVAGRMAEMQFAWGNTNRPQADAAIAARIAACAKADAANATLAEANAEHVAATALLQAAYAKGLQRPSSDVGMVYRMQTEAAEVEMWTGMGVAL